MRALFCAAVLLGGCTLPLTSRVGVHVGFESSFGYRANAVRPRSFVGLRFSITRHP